MPDAATRALALEMLARLGVSPEDLLAAHDTPAAPTIAEYLPTVERATPTKAARTFASYWKRLNNQLGDRRIDDVRTSDIATFARTCRENAQLRRNTIGGTGAETNAITTARAFFRLAVQDGIISSNPAAAVRKPRRNPRERRALTPAEIADLDQIARTRSDDPELDTLLVRFHLETAARRQGAIGLRMRDLDYRRQVVRLLEKGDKQRDVPVTAELLDHLQNHATRRAPGATGDDPVLRYRSGAPLTRRRYNTLAERWQRELSWTATAPVSIHWLRHTALTEVERIAGHAVAAALAGHAPTSVTASYTKATIAEVARALEIRTGTTHPLATAD
ncbi:tyrosine-type recombinase/integrase [Cellulomonas sp. P24]|uniref:tyrosine-type recombinase/integrase n=1 Tax=Cellulomonas sp. P24 TaxID=2885206 RepID=UPI00216B2CCC|nr:tyrosine-type recombinase/integrase [Cellulomonas sp. P24]MCR6491161.1 tyrosine-type recombinase/integrase [Cellulomonas sp. P24]